MKKRIFNTALVAAAALGLTATLSSCGSKSNPEKTIVFVSTMGDALQKVANVAIENFETKFPGWKIDHQQPGGYDQVRDRVIGDLGADTQPDLAYCYADHVAMYLQTKKVVDINKFINSTATVDAVINGETVKETVGYTAAEKADIIETYMSEGIATNFAGYDNYDYAADALLMLPFSKSTEALYYNADVLQELNLEVPETWDDLWAACSAIKAKYPESTPLGYDSEANWFITMCEQNGWGYTSAQKPHYLFNNDDTVNWLNDVKAKYDEGLFITKTLYGGSYTSNLFVKGVKAGGSAFSIGSTGGASNQASKEFNWGVTKLPGTRKSDNTIDFSNISQGPNLVMFKTSFDNADEKQIMTWEFIKCLLEPKFQAQFSMKSGYNPVRLSTYEIEDYADWLDGEDITAVTAKMSSTITDWFFTSPAFIGSSTAREQVGSALVNLLAGIYSTAEGALARAVKNCGGN